MDGVFAIWPHGDQTLDEFLTHLNSQHPTIPFTMEKEEDQNILEEMHTNQYMITTHTITIR